MKKKMKGETISEQLPSQTTGKLKSKKNNEGRKELVTTCDAQIHTRKVLALLVLEQQLLRVKEIETLEILPK